MFRIWGQCAPPAAVRQLQGGSGDSRDASTTSAINCPGPKLGALPVLYRRATAAGGMLDKAQARVIICPGPRHAATSMKASFQLTGLVAGLGLGFAAWSAEPGLVAHFDFDEGSGSVLRDASGNGDDGQIHGPVTSRGGGVIASSSTARKRL